MLTSLLIHAQHGNTRTRTPRGNLTRIIDHRFQPILLASFRRQLQYDTQMLRHFAQVLDILLDQLGRAVVVVQHRQYTIDNRMVGLSEADVDAEDGVDDAEDEAMNEMPYRWAYALLVVEADVPGAGVVGGGLFCGLVGEVGSHHLLPLRDRQMAAFLIAAGVEGSRLATADHCEVWMSHAPLLAFRAGPGEVL